MSVPSLTTSSSSNVSHCQLDANELPRSLSGALFSPRPAGLKEAIRPLTEDREITKLEVEYESSSGDESSSCDKSDCTHCGDGQLHDSTTAEVYPPINP